MRGIFLNIHSTAKVMLVLLLGLAVSAHALEIESVYETEIFTSEEFAHKRATTVGLDIDRGTFDIAIGEASVECPEDNFPKFKVLRIGINSYWLPNSVDAEDKMYSATVIYTINCDVARTSSSK